MNIRHAEIMREKSDEINKGIINKLEREINELIERGLDYAYKNGCYKIETIFEDMDSEHIDAITPYLNQTINKLIDLGYNARFSTINNHKEKRLEDLEITIKW